MTKSDYCNSIDIAGSTIAILLLLGTTIVILQKNFRILSTYLAEMHGMQQHIHPFVI